MSKSSPESQLVSARTIEKLEFLRTCIESQIMLLVERLHWSFETLFVYKSVPEHGAKTLVLIKTWTRRNKGRENRNCLLKSRVTAMRRMDTFLGAENNIIVAPSPPHTVRQQL